MMEFMENITLWDIIGRLVVGLILLNLLFSIARGLYGSFIAAALGLNADLPKYGKWAVVTGSTDGIGKAFALELAKRGMNIVLISRSLHKLQNVAAEIEQKHGRQTKMIDVDFTCIDIYERIRSELENLEIGVLINNVGMASPLPDYHEALTDKFLKDTILCNIMSVTMMTKVVLPEMKRRKKGMIINVSSLGSLIPTPLLTVYGATKAFMTDMSRSMMLELENSGVELQCLCPGYVVSRMSRIKVPYFSVPTPEVYVRWSLNSTGVDAMTAGYHLHSIVVYGIELFNKYLPLSIVGNMFFSIMKTLRARYFRRAAKKE